MPQYFVYVTVRGQLVKLEFQRKIPILEIAKLVSQREDVDPKRISLTYKGEVIDQSRTMDDLRIADLSILECMILDEDHPLVKENASKYQDIYERTGIKVKIQGSSRESMSYFMSEVCLTRDKEDKFDTIIDRYAVDTQIDKKKFKFIFDGSYLDLDLTPRDMYLDCDFCIDVIPID
ncbi:NFATC2-interacting protein [Thelohanellus kitauei]|uniref:NFATC2-interacting protein n=1 Tax=Thelohanellus kitauei TaxID=669202 RepID=A0A0C2MSI4_THEKT|nr:NFATC2-interacting protein [Thelohanellus kitauei]